MKNFFKFITILIVSSLIPAYLFAEVINSISFNGNKRINTDYLLSLLNSKEHSNYDESTFNKDLDNLYKTDFFESVSGSFSNGVLTINLQENPVISSIKFAGNKKIKEDVLKKEITINQRDSFSTNKLNMAVQRLTEVYHKSGYLSVVINPEVIKQDFDRIEIVFNIIENKKSVIKVIKFIGNNNFSKSDLEDAMLTKESKWWRFLNSGEVYDKNRILYDGELLKEFYLENGYPNFALISTFSEISPTDGQFIVTYTIEENERYKFGSLITVNKVKALEPYEAELSNLVQIDTSMWFKNSLLKKEIEKVKQRIKELGFQFIKVNQQLVFNELTKSVDIALVIEEEPKVFINKINITGNTRTLDNVIRRELPFVEQDPYSRDSINEATRNLYRTQFFQSVNITNSPSSESGKTDVNVDIEEMSTGSISVGGGFSTVDKLQFEASYNETNVFGTGQNFGINLSLSQNTNNYSVSLANPYFLGKQVYASASLYRIDTKTSSLYYYSLYKQTEQGASFSLGYNLTQNLTQSFGYKIFTRNIYDVASNASISIKQLSGKSSGSIISHTLYYDKRNNALFPTKGFDASLTTEYAGIIGTDNYIKNTFKTIWYQSIYQDIVFSVLGSVGAIEGLNGKEVNIVNKFFIGGPTLRGFRINTNQGGVGPVDKETRESLGGKYMFRGSFQIEMPLPVVKNYGLLFHIFNDYGTVTDFSKSPSVIDTASIRSSVGVGISWRSPIGTIGIDIGYPIIKESTDVPERIFINFGSRL